MKLEFSAWCRQQNAAKAETMIFSQKLKAVNCKKSNYFKK
jgi:hypothetical protein